MNFPFSDIEDTARKIWADQDVYTVSNKSDQPKYYVLDMFPYPSGAGLHVGHPLGYIASDIISRYKRQKGFNVLHPMGFDAFGLPAEQYAIQTGQHPKTTTEQNIQRYKEQLNQIGFCYDWSREVRTSDPNFYRWTQWIFSQLFNHYYDLKENKAKSINSLVKQFELSGNQLSNIHNTKVFSFDSEQWKAFSEEKKAEILMQYRLAYLDLSMVNWCQELGTVLANDEVINGKSERGGYAVEKRPMRQWFLRITSYANRLLNDLEELDWSDSMKEMQRNWIGKSQGALVQFPTETNHQIDVFTTRADTIYGVTFMVLAPEHDLVETFTTDSQKEEVENYVAYVKSRTDIERQQEKKITGAFTGSYAIHPFSGNKLPIYISEYVLIGYGTGAIMAVPSDDERDQNFAKKFGLEIIPVVDQSNFPNASTGDKVGKMINSDFLNDLSVKEAIKTAIDRIEDDGKGERKINYRLRDAGYSRQRYWGEPFPVVYQNGIAQLTDEALPVTLPAVDSYLPTGDGQSPLAAVDNWVNVSDGIKRETDTMPGYAGSSWYFLRYMDPNNSDRFVSKEAEEYWENVDLYIGGTEHAVGHLLYSRFWQKFLFDLGEVSQKEPFKRLVNQGMIQGRSLFIDLTDGRSLHVPIQFADRDDQLSKDAWQKAKQVDNRLAGVDDGIINWIDGQSIQLRAEVEKMSKSKFNVVNPDDIINEYGADVFRMYEMFLGPIEQSKPWDTKGIDGVFKFIRRFWNLFYNEEQWIVTDDEATKDELKTLHTCIKKVTDDIERMSFNTCVSAFMIATNELTSQNCHKASILKPMVALLSPFAPHTAEKLWQELGGEGSVVDAEFPVFDEQHLVEDEKEYPVSINGKMRVKIKLPSAIQQDEAKEAVLANEVVQKWLEGKEMKKFIFVPGRIINIVV